MSKLTQKINEILEENKKLKQELSKKSSDKIDVEIASNTKEFTQLIDSINGKFTELALIINQQGKVNADDSKKLFKSIETLVNLGIQNQDVLENINENSAKEIEFPEDKTGEIVDAVKKIDVKPNVYVEQREYNLAGITKVLESYFQANKEWLKKQTITIKQKSGEPLKVNIVDKNGRIIDFTRIFSGGGGSIPVYHTGFIDGNSNEKYALVDASGHQQVDIVGGNVTLNATDIEIGAVELKNGTDDTRATIETDGTDNALIVKQNAQPLPSGASTEATLTDIKTAVQVIDNFISGTKGLVTEDNSAAIKSAVETIDNCISGNEAQVDVVGALPAGTAIIGAVKRDVVNYTPIRKYYSNTGAVTDGIVWSPAAGKKWVVTDIIMTTSAAATVTLEDDKSAGDAAVFAVDLAANGGISTNLQTPIQSEEADADLIVTTSAGNIKIIVCGYEI